MSHSTQITLIADQEIKILDEKVNIHDIKTIVLNEKGKIKAFYKKIAQEIKEQNINQKH